MIAVTIHTIVTPITFLLSHLLQKHDITIGQNEYNSYFCKNIAQVYTSI